MTNPWICWMSRLVRTDTGSILPHPISVLLFFHRECRRTHLLKLNEIQMNIKNFIIQLFKRDYTNYEGVPRINIYVMRLFFLLMFIFVGFDSWTSIINHHGPWKPITAVALCVWAAYSTLSALGVVHTLKMLPIMLFMIFYKTLWLIVVAYPLWITNQLAGSDAEEMASVVYLGDHTHSRDAVALRI